MKLTHCSSQSLRNAYFSNVIIYNAYNIPQKRKKVKKNDKITKHSIAQLHNLDKYYCNMIIYSTPSRLLATNFKMLTYKEIYIFHINVQICAILYQWNIAINKYAGYNMANMRNNISGFYFEILDQNLKQILQLFQL